MHGVHSAMDEKRRLAQQHGGPNTSKPSRALRRILAAVFILLILSYYTCYSLLPHAPAAVISPARHQVQTLFGQEPAATESKVPLEAHIISKCPDTRVRYPISEKTGHRKRTLSNCYTGRA